MASMKRGGRKLQGSLIKNHNLKFSSVFKYCFFKQGCCTTPLVKFPGWFAVLQQASWASWQARGELNPRLMRDRHLS